MQSKLLISLMALGFLAACGEESPDQIDTITKMKILAVRADQPDLHPGETTRVQVLVAAPNATSMTTFILPFSQTAVADYGKGKAEFGSSGMAFNFVPGTTIPTAPVDFGVSLPRKAAPNFGQAFYQAPATPGAYTLGVFVREGVPSIDFGAAPEKQQAQLSAEMSAALKAFKTIRVVPKDEKLNANPEIERIDPVRRWREVKDGRREGEIAPDGYSVQPEQVIRLQTRFKDEKPDRPSTIWWFTDGEANGYGRNDIDWLAPKKAGIYTLIALLLDREGGADWHFQDVVVGEPAPELRASEFKNTDERYGLMARSEGRMLWLTFPEKTSATTVANALAKGPVVLSGHVRADRAARLGWYLENPSFAGMAEDFTTSTVTAGEVYGMPAKPVPVAMRFEEVVSGVKGPLKLSQ